MDNILALGFPVSGFKCEDDAAVGTLTSRFLSHFELPLLLRRVCKAIMICCFCVRNTFCLCGKRGGKIEK